MPHTTYCIVLLLFIGQFSCSQEAPWLQRILEPTTRHSLEPSISDKQKIIYFCTSPNGFTIPLAKLFSDIFIEDPANKNTQNLEEKVSLAALNYKNTIYNQDYFTMLLNSLPYLDCCLTPFFNTILNQNQDLFFNNNLMMFKGRQLSYDFIKDISKENMRQLYVHSSKKFSFIYSFLSIITSVIISFAYYTTPELFSQNTYFSSQELAWDKHWFFYVALFWCKNNEKRIDTIGTLPFLSFPYTLNNALTDIDTIFQVKKMLFFISIVCSLLNLKPSKNVFTNPHYWLPIGIAHLFFIKNKCPHRLTQFISNTTMTQENNLSDKTSSLNYFNLKIANYLLWYPIPITIVCIQALCNSTLTQKFTK